MEPGKADVVICGAGIAGIAAAYALAVRRGVRNVLLVDERAPLTLTSDKSTEAYRNWWPGPGDAMARLMDRSIDLLEDLAEASDNYFHLNRRGYVYLTADSSTQVALQSEAQAISALGAGPLRVHAGRSPSAYRPAPAHGFAGQPDGADLLLDPALIRTHYPYLNPGVCALLHPRRCGWLSAQQLGMYLLDQARAHGVTLHSGRVAGVDVAHNRVTAVHVQAASAAARIQTPVFVNAAGPLLKAVGRMVGVDLPVFNELHAKLAFDDVLGIVPREAPLLIWNDPIVLPWTDAERADLAELPETAWLLDPLPAGLHFRPEGGPGSQTLLALWPYHIDAVERPSWPLHFPPEYQEVLMRGLCVMVPQMAAYLDRMPKPWVDGGYYCKTRENRPLIGPLPVDGAFVIGALSGYGVMAAAAAGELLAAHVTGGALPDYAPAFDLRRYDDPVYQALLAGWSATKGQL